MITSGVLIAFEQKPFAGCSSDDALRLQDSVVAQAVYVQSIGF